MSNLLIDESPQTYKPTLAAWIGLNEAIFLQQLHYILTQNDSVGKFADGRKWYRDKPRDFMVKYFPFWDEGTVKRTMANLRADALILVRSDLNKDTQDRSLWYTVHYQAIERLSGPVERIRSKSDKRKEARKARGVKSDSQPEYTKVQNVLMAKVQIVEPVDKSTKRTEGQVQIVPTPKDSLSKTPLTPKGVVGKPLAPIPKRQKGQVLIIPSFKVFVEITEYYAINAHWRGEMARIVGDKPEDLEFWRKVIIGWTGKYPSKHNVEGMLDFYKRREIPGYQKSSNGIHPANKSSPLSAGQREALKQQQAQDAKEIHIPGS